MREISRESYRQGVLTGYLSPELSHENSLAKSRAVIAQSNLIMEILS